MMLRRILAVACVSVLSLLVGCGGGGSASSTPPPPSPPPPPAALVITTGSLPTGTPGVFYTAPVLAAGGTPPYTWTSINPLPDWLSQDLPTGALTGIPPSIQSINVTLKVQDSGSPAQTTQNTLTLSIVVLPPLVQNTTLPAAIVGRPYSAGLAGIFGTPPYTWSITSGILPTGLALDPSGLISGTPTAAGTSPITVLLTDSGSPVQTAGGSLQMQVNALPLGRNDSIATATPLTNGTYDASISPYSDPSTTAPDGDYYELTATPGTTAVGVAILAARLSPASPLDSVIEIVDGSGNRFSTCNDPIRAFLNDIGPPFVPDPTPSNYDDPCINDDDPTTGTTDSFLSFQPPGSFGDPPVTFYVHVIDWRGDARPEMLYQIQISGAN